MSAERVQARYRALEKISRRNFQGFMNAVAEGKVDRIIASTQELGCVKRWDRPDSAVEGGSKNQKRPIL